MVRYLSIRVGFLLKQAMLIAALAVAGITAAQAERLQVVASFSILGDMTRVVAGDAADVAVIVGPNADAHTYSPSVTDARTVAGADLILVNGLGFETWSRTLIETSGTKAPVVVATDGIAALTVEGEPDPHAWNSLKNATIYVDNIAKALSAADADNAATYRANASAYRAELKTLASEVGAIFASLPADRRTVVTAHDAFGYLEEAYGLRFLAPLGISDEAEPSAQELAALIEQLRQEKVAALFVENIKSPALVQQISRETGIELGGRLFSDALSREGPAQTYLGMMRHNARSIAAALTRE